MGRENAVFVHLTLLPFIATAGELKTKPTQHSVMKMREIGIQPDILVWSLVTERSRVSRDTREDRAVHQRAERATPSFALKDEDTIYEVPLALHEAGLDDGGVRAAQYLERVSRSSSRWNENRSHVHQEPEGRGAHRIVVGKYVDLAESYKSLSEALTHGGLANNCRR